MTSYRNLQAVLGWLKISNIENKSAPNCTALLHACSVPDVDTHSQCSLGFVETVVLKRLVLTEADFRNLLTLNNRCILQK